MCASISEVVKRRGNCHNCTANQLTSLRHHHHYHHLRRSHISQIVLTRFRQFLRPKMIVIIALLLCWNLGNSFVVAVYNPRIGADSNNYAFPYYRHVSHESQPPHHSQHGNHHHHNALNTVRLRPPPPPLNQLSSSEPASVFDLGGQGITMSDATALVGPLTGSSSPSSSLVPFESAQSGAADMELGEQKRKKNCGQPSVATRGLLGPTMKRSYFAFTQDEVDEKVRNDEYRQAAERKKREIQHQMLSPSSRHQLVDQHEQTKRNGAAGEAGPGAAAGGGSETQDTPLPWTCETKYEWKDMGADHYPRFVRTAECKSRLCFNGFFRCRPRRYKTKVLKKIAPADTTSCEDDDVSLPETLRSNWKFITVTINLCCDCTGRIPGNTEV